MVQEKPVWNILKILDWTKQYFKNKGLENPRLDAEVLLCAVLNCERIKLYVNFDQPLEEEELAQYREYVQRRGKMEPLAYIIGHKEFMDSDFKVTTDTLVPRPETELLVEELIRMNETKGPREILDIGCGSGAILLSLLKELPEARGLGIDINPGAVAVTMENAKSLQLEDRCAVLVSDLYTNLPRDDKFNLIVSNPPYIPTGDISGLAQDVQKEPRAALDGGIDGLDYYKRILEHINDYLLPTGMAAFEIGINQGDQVAELCKEAGLSITAIGKDYGNIDRMVFATKEGTDYANEIIVLRRKFRSNRRQI